MSHVWEYDPRAQLVYFKAHLYMIQYLVTCMERMSQFKADSRLNTISKRQCSDRALTPILFAVGKAVTNNGHTFHHIPHCKEAKEEV